MREYFREATCVASHSRKPKPRAEARDQGTSKGREELGRFTDIGIRTDIGVITDIVVIQADLVRQEVTGRADVSEALLKA
jgi:hypothetical protein